MNSQNSTQIARRGGAWLLGAVAFMICAAAGPATAFAGIDQGCEELNTEINTSAADLGQPSQEQNEASPPPQSRDMAPRVGLTPVPTRGFRAPCRFSESDSPSFNACFAANPQPVSAMPKWIATMQAEEAVGNLFSEINEILDEPSPRASDQPLWQAAAPVWLDDVIEELRRTQRVGDPGRVCIDNQYEEQCHSLPSSAVVVTAGSLSPIERTTRELELPWKPDEDTTAQPALVDLRVGPSDEHRRLPERPPEA